MMLDAFKMALNEREQLKLEENVCIYQHVIYREII